MRRENKSQGAPEKSDIREGYYETFRAYYPLILFFGLLLLLSFLHFYPQGAYPLHGLSIISGFLIIALTMFLMGCRGGRIGKQGAISLWLYSLFLGWCLLRNSFAPAPAIGRSSLAIILEGFWILAAAQIALSLERAPGSSLNVPSVDTHRENLSLSPENLSLRSLVFLYFALLMTLFCVHGIYQYFFGYERQLEMISDVYSGSDQLSRSILYALKERRVSSRFGNPNLFAGFLGASLPFMLYIFFRFRTHSSWKNAGIKILFAGFGLIVIFVLILTQSRGGMLSFLFGGALFASLYAFYNRKDGYLFPAGNKKLFMKIIIAFAALFATGGIFLLIQNATRTRDFQGGSFLERLFRAGTIRERFYYFRTGWEIIRRNPIFGSGPAGYELYYPRFRCFEARETKYAHNFIVQMWAELGITGLGLFFALIFYHIRIAVRSAKENPEVIVFLCAVLIFLFNSLFEYGFYHDSLYLNFCLCLGVIAGTYPPEKKIGKSRRMPVSSGPTRYFIYFSIPLILSIPLFFGSIFKPFYSAFQTQFGDDLLVDGNHEKALVHYRIAVRYQPDNPWNHQRLGRTLLTLGDTMKAEEHLKKAVTLHPLSASLKDELARFYESTFRIQDAIEYQRAATQAYPLKAEYHYNLAKLLWKDGKAEEAKETMREAVRVELDPSVKNKYQDFLNEL